jgi:hypothetical protein
MQFEAEIQVAGYRVVNFDPTQNVKAATPEQASYAKRCFAIRCVKNILYPQNKIAQNHFECLAERVMASDVETKELLEAEMQKGMMAKNNEINILVDSINNDELAIDEYASRISDLRKLDPNHVLVTSFIKDLKIKKSNEASLASSAAMDVDRDGPSSGA